VIFRDGFESDAGPAPGAQHAGTLDDAATLVLDPAAAPVADAPQPWLGAYDAHGRVVFRIESLRGSGPPLVRIVGSDADGRESHGAWLALAGHKAALALATTPAKAHAVILLGAGDASLQATLPSWVTLPLQVDVAQ
jgi:hypothetical protein